MATLIVGSTTIPLAADGGLSLAYDETGERVRMFDASMLESVRGRKQVLTCRSQPATRATAETYKTALLASPPIACTGDAFNGVATNCFAKVSGLIPVPTAAGLRWSVTFTLYEA